MKVSEKEFLDKLKSLKKVNTWTAEKHLKKQELIEYVNNFDCLNFSINYFKNSFGFSQKSWEYKKYKVPNDKRGFLKKYRGLDIILLNTGKVNMFKLEIIAFPYTK